MRSGVLARCLARWATANVEPAGTSGCGRTPFWAAAGSPGLAPRPTTQATLSTASGATAVRVPTEPARITATALGLWAMRRPATGAFEAVLAVTLAVALRAPPGARRAPPLA